MARLHPNRNASRPPLSPALKRPKSEACNAGSLQRSTQRPKVTSERDGRERPRRNGTERSLLPRRGAREALQALSGFAPVLQWRPEKPDPSATANAVHHQRGWRLPRQPLPTFFRQFSANRNPKVLVLCLCQTGISSPRDNSRFPHDPVLTKLCRLKILL